MTVSPMARQKLSKAQLRTAMERMDPDGDGEVTSSHPKRWQTGRLDGVGHLFKSLRRWQVTFPEFEAWSDCVRPDCHFAAPPPPLLLPTETPTEGRRGCSRMTVSPTARWIAFGDEARERPRVPKCELLWSTCGFGMCATACGYGTASHWPATAVPPAAVSLPPHHRHQVPGTGAAARHRRGARRGRAGLAGGETATLLHPPLPFSRCFNMDGKGASAG